MKYSNLGRTGLKVSRIGLGTMNFGMETSEADSLAVLDAALDAGINFVDTADVYGGPQSPDIKQGYGISEEIHRPLAGPRQRSPRQDRARHQAVPADGRPDPTIVASRPTTSARPARTACVAWGPTTSTCTRCTMSTEARRGRRSGRRWSSSCAPAR